MTLPVAIPEGVVLPQPAGYRILIAIANMDKKIGNIHLPDKYVQMEQTASIVGLVISMGSTAYKDPDRYPDGPWCQVGDWVVFRAYSGSRLKVGDQEFRLINDDTVEAVVEDPRAVMRAY